MSETLGTDAGNLTGQGGAISNTAGDALLGTDNDGSQSYALGSSLSRAISTGVINGDFGTPPPELSTNIDNAENALPYFTTEVSHTDATAPYVQAVDDATAASGQVLRFTIPSGAAIGRYARIVRYVAVPGSAARTWTNQPRAAWRNATGTTKTQASVTIATQYYQNDGTTTTGTAGSNSATFATIFASTYAYETQANPNSTGAIPTDGAFIKITVGVLVNVLTTSAMTVDLTEVRNDRGLIQLLLADQVDPSAYGYGVIYLNNGTMWIRANELGSSGSNPTIQLQGSTGSIIIDPTSTGTAQVTGNLSGTGTITATSHVTGDRFYPGNQATRYIEDNGTYLRSRDDFWAVGSLFQSSSGIRVPVIRVGEAAAAATSIPASGSLTVTVTFPALPTTPNFAVLGIRWAGADANATVVVSGFTSTTVVTARLYNQTATAITSSRAINYVVGAEN